MNNHRLRQCLQRLHWSGRTFAELIGVDERQVRRWLAGTSAVPCKIGQWLEQVAGFVERHPPPARVQRSSSVNTEPAQEPMR